MDEELLEALDEVWDIDTGFLGRLRAGHFDPEAGEEYVALLSRIPPVGDTVDYRLVQRIWFAPTFIEWQIERATKSPGDEVRLRRIESQVREAVVAVLGVP
ncbi:hypothetical protein SAMN04487904_107163 [Actinopolyspora lacussalsi subsp. righensis]|uniref:Uncharacterized protein n=2 Tax=Actinopolyspora alba group TaxID=2893675 RepID=A0A1I2BMB7_9ACTN|nr:MULTISPECIES: hypothetical protein [Actinopolyspora alba group]SFE57364.1 hypothetical protein SAMN04487819_1173 [Actinopolyspora alba]SFT75479.1 hypothetical protein SAMN04487904_107163 [Actinopolyspora righensis]